MEALAPWAEPVLMTADELLRLPEDVWRYELVEGRLVRMSPTGGEHGLIVMALLMAVGRFVGENNLGEVLPPETGFLISPPGSPDTVLAPDLAFVRRDRGTMTRVEGFPRLAPDLVAEVVSPSQGRVEMGAKAQQWLRAGVLMVWLLFPAMRTVEVWRGDRLVQTLPSDGELSGEEILPGLVLPLADVFP
jgi:Uma2 family endonuclease